MVVTIRDGPFQSSAGPIACAAKKGALHRGPESRHCVGVPMEKAVFDIRNPARCSPMNRKFPTRRHASCLNGTLYRPIARASRMLSKTFSVLAMNSKLK